MSADHEGRWAAPSELDGLWDAVARRLEHDDGWAFREVLAAGVAAYTRDDDTPEDLLIRHNPNCTRDLVRLNPDGPDTVIRAL